MNMERINAPVSTAELERRWAAVRAAMEERGIDALLLQANNDFMGGYLKWFTDLPATNGYPATVVFPREERMTMIGQGPLNAVTEYPPEGDALRRGVARFIGSPSYVAAGYSMANDTALAARALAPWARGTIGLVAPGGIGHSLVDGLQKGECAGARWVDASDLVDAIKAVKSDEEIAALARSASTTPVVGSSFALPAAAWWTKRHCWPRCKEAASPARRWTSSSTSRTSPRR